MASIKKVLRGINNDVLRDIVKEAFKQGWTIDRTSKNHLKFVPPPDAKGPLTGCVFFSGTSSDWRAPRTLKSDLRKRGLTI